MNKSSPQNKNQNIKEALTEASSILNIWRENRAIVLKPKEKMAILQRRDVMAILISSTGFGQRGNILIENLCDRNFPSKKYCRRPDIGNVIVVKEWVVLYTYFAIS